MQLPEIAAWADRCNTDGEFQLAARYWNGGLRLNIGTDTLQFAVADGAAEERPAPATKAPGVIELTAEVDFWERMLAGVPPRFYTDLMASIGSGLGAAPQRRSAGLRAILWRCYAGHRAVTSRASRHEQTSGQRSAV